jgi:ribosome maturation factor RimP
VRGFVVKGYRSPRRAVQRGRSAIGALEEVRDLAEAVAERRSLRLWDVEMGGQPGRAIVRVFVDGDDGVDLDTVAEVSEEISRGLDLRDPIQGRYTLEVSSPGLERSLKEPEHWRLSVGKKVIVKTKDKLVGDSHRLDAIVDGTTGDSVVLRPDGREGTVEVPFEAIRSARTVFEWNAGGDGAVKNDRSPRRAAKDQDDRSPRRAAKDQDDRSPRRAAKEQKGG